jgi:hypothetical protein
MASNCIVMCGNKVLHWNLFSQSLSREWHPCISLPPALRIGTLNDQPQSQSFVEPLAASRACSYSDPRDKVFALLALITDNHRISLQPDYSKSASWLFVQIAAWCIASNKDLRILRYLQQPDALDNDRLEVIKLPS